MTRFAARILWFFLFSVAIRWPAVVDPWWRQDDHLVRVQDLWSAEGVSYYLRMGRPGSLAFHAGVKPAYEDAGWAMAVRLLGLLLLAASGAAITASFIARAAPPSGAVAAGLYVVTWPFAGEVTVWLDGIVVVLACVLSIAGTLAALSPMNALAIPGIGAITLQLHSRTDWTCDEPRPARGNGIEAA